MLNIKQTKTQITAVKGSNKIIFNKCGNKYELKVITLYVDNKEIWEKKFTFTEAVIEIKKYL